MMDMQTILIMTMVDKITHFVAVLVVWSGVSGVVVWAS